jgi:DNA invertase Pin-like site-specific DNA recombinase
LTYICVPRLFRKVAHKYIAPFRFAGYNVYQQLCLSGVQQMTAAIYCRLSREDDGKQTESESVQNQKSLLIKYAVEKGWDIYNIFCDEDYSGIDRNRPAFNQLIKEAEQGKFSVVLVKTQSRFTRDMEMVERYIHGKFIEWGIRFVALVDNIDTDVKGNKKARQINGLINEWYLEDLSENIRAVFDNKRKNGQYIGGFPIYGYTKPPGEKNKLVIDPVPAEIVRRIFRLYLAGHGKQHIAYILNEEGVLNPTKYKQNAGWGYVNGCLANEYGLWNRTTVGRILRERMYTGDMVQGKRKKVSYKSAKFVDVPEKDWFIVPDTHEAIIDKSAFETVRRLMNERTTSSGFGPVHVLAGKIRCMQCGSTMCKTSHTYKGNRRSYLRCKLYAADKTLCAKHAIRLDALEKNVLQRLQQYIARYYDDSHTDELLRNGRHVHKKAVLQREIKTLTAEVDRRGKAMGDLYLDKSQGIIEEEQFIDLNQGYLNDKEQLQKRLSLLSSQLEELESHSENHSTVREKIKQWLNVQELSRELAAEFINTIEIGERDPVSGHQTIRINWLF